jgi:hypothetical protein
MIEINVIENLRGKNKWTILRNWQHEGAITNGQSREIGNIGYTRHRTRQKKQKPNTEKKIYSFY